MPGASAFDYFQQLKLEGAKRYGRTQVQAQLAAALEAEDPAAVTQLYATLCIAFVTWIYAVENKQGGHDLSHEHHDSVAARGYL